MNTSSPCCRKDMLHVQDNENLYWPGEIANSDYKCPCGKIWVVNGFGEMWMKDQKPRLVKILKTPEIGDNYNDVIKPL
jgi:hypothetical protein